MPVPKPKTYNPAIDILRFISILAVILIHTTTKTIQAVSGNLHLVPWTLFLNQISRFAVPLFFLISGFVLELSSSESINYLTYLKKRLSRILAPYITWSLIYYFLIYRGNSLSFFHILITGGASYQLYFIPSLLIFYLIFPVFHKFYNFFANRWVLISLGILQLIFLYHDYYFGSYPIFYPLNIALLNYYFFVLGIISSRNQLILLKIYSKFKYPLLIITCFLATYISFEGWSRFYSTGNYLAFYSQWRPSVFFYTVFLSIVLYHFLNKIHLPEPVVKTLSPHSFFVFFIHIAVLELIWNHIGVPLFTQTHGLIVRQLWFDPVFFAVVATISFVIAYLCHRLPFLSKLTG